MKTTNTVNRKISNAKNDCIRLVNFVVLSILPFIYGCVPGSGSLGSLFGSGGGGGNIASVAGDSGTIATFHNPEPTSMLLMGGGMMAMAYYKNRKKH